MPRHTGTVFVDTNVILECHRVGSWRALIGGYLVETVDECVDETQAGAQRLRKEQDIDQDRLMDQLAAVHSVEDRDLAALAVRTFGLALDEGEEALWAHAIGRDDDWILCGPDAASLRCGVRLECRERLRSLEGLLEDLGHWPSIPLKTHYTESWHRQTLELITFDEMD